MEYNLVVFEMVMYKSHDVQLSVLSSNDETNIIAYIYKKSGELEMLKSFTSTENCIYELTKIIEI